MKWGGGEGTIRDGATGKLRVCARARTATCHVCVLCLCLCVWSWMYVWAGPAMAPTSIFL